MPRDSDFPTGIAVFFRALAKDDTMARSFHLNGRHVEMGVRYGGHDEDYVILDEEMKVLGIYPRDFVSAIMPLTTVGPGAENANNPSFKPAR